MIDTEKAQIEKRLLAFARPELYRANAFRVLGLQRSATDKEISRRVQELELSSKFGGTITTDNDNLALEPRPSIDQIREASQRLKDPETRFLDEFFWPRISKMLGQTLSKGDNQAIRIWLDEDTREAADGEGNALHNLAVLTHLRVLDLELLAASQPLGESLIRYRDGAWDNVYRYWRELLSREEFWRKQEQRIREVNDPRLPPTFSSELREFLPSLVLIINAQLAIRAADAGQGENVKRHADLIYTAEFDNEVIFNVLGQATVPARKRLTLLCERAGVQAETEPVKAKQAAVELLTTARPILSLLDDLFGVDDVVPADAFDLVARTGLNCLHAYGRQSKDWKSLLPHLEEILGLARNDSLVSQIQESLKVVRENADFVQVEPLFARIQAIMDSNESLATKFALLQSDVVLNVRDAEARLSEDSETFENLSNMLAGALRSLSVDLHNDEEDFVFAHSAIVLAREFAIDAELRKKIEADLLTVREHAEHAEIMRGLKPIKKAPDLGTINSIGLTLYGRSDFEPKMNSYLTTLYFVFLAIPLFPVGRYRVINAGNNTYRFLGKCPLRKIDKWHIGAFAFSVLLVVIWIGVAGQSSSSSTDSSRSSTPYPANRPSTLGTSVPGNSRATDTRSSSNVSTVRSSPTPKLKELNALETSSPENYNYRNVEAEGLRAEIDRAKQTLNSLKSEIDSLRQEVFSYKQQIDSYAAVLRKLKRDNDLGYQVDEDEYERARRNHNYNVDLYNAKLSEVNEKVDEYNQLLEETKEKIDRYNRMVRGGP